MYSALKIEPSVLTHAAISATLTQVTAQQTSDNAAIVITWDAIATETVAPLLRLYDVEYRMQGRVESVLEPVGNDSSIFVIQGLRNADSYEVQIFNYFLHHC